MWECVMGMEMMVSQNSGSTSPQQLAAAGTKQTQQLPASATRLGISCLLFPTSFSLPAGSLLGTYGPILPVSGKVGCSLIC